MSTDKSWGTSIQVLPESTMNSKVLFSLLDANSLGNVVNSITLASVLYGDWTEFMSSFMYYPIIIDADRTVPNHFVTSGIEFKNVSTKGLMTTYASLGAFTLGEYYYPVATTFLDFEPYTKLEIYLPYYGFTQLKIADVQGKYIQFRLNIDWSSGQAVYTISCSNTAVNDTSDLPYARAGSAYKNCRVLTTLVFQLGYSIPITTANFNDTIRNIATMAVKGGVAIATSFASESLPSSSSQTTTKTVNTSRNKKTGRQVTKTTQTKTAERETYSYDNYSRINTAVNTSATILSHLNAHGSTDKPNNCCLNGGVGKSVVIIKTSAIPTFDIENNADYKHLVGLPNGTVGRLGDFNGFTSVSNVHLEGVGFSGATVQEMSMLESVLTQGVIL